MKKQSRLVTIWEIKLPMFFNLISKTTHFVFRQNRSRKHTAFVQLGLLTGLDFLVPRDSHGTEEKKEKKNWKKNWKKKKNFENSWLFLTFFCQSDSAFVPGRPGTGRDSLFKIPSRPVAGFWACPVVPLSWDNEETSVPLSRKVAVSRPVGNPSWEQILYRIFFYKWIFHQWEHLNL